MTKSVFGSRRSTFPLLSSLYTMFRYFLIHGLLKYRQNARCEFVGGILQRRHAQDAIRRILVFALRYISQGKFTIYTRRICTDVADSEIR